MALKRTVQASSLELSERVRGVLDLMPRTLARVVALYESEGVPLPDRRYWMLGPEPSEDCEQLVINFLQAYLGTPGDQASDAQQCNQPTTGVMNISITRSFPIGDNGRPISPDRIMEASAWGAIDVGVLSSGLREISAMVDDFVGPGIIATVSVGKPEGGLQTTVLNLSLVVS